MMHQRHHHQPYYGVARIEERDRSHRRPQHDKARSGHGGEHRAEIPVAAQQERHALDQQYAGGGEKHLVMLAEIREVAHIAQHELRQVGKHRRQHRYEPAAAQLQEQHQKYHDEREGDAVGQELEQVARHHLTTHSRLPFPPEKPDTSAVSPGLCPGRWECPSRRP